MTGPARQAILFLAVLAVLALIGFARPSPPGVEAAAQPTSSTTAGPLPTTAATTGSVAEPDPATTPTVATTVSVTVAPARPLDVVVYPSEAEAMLTLVDGSGQTLTAPSPFDGDMVGPVELSVEAEGFRPERLTIPAEAEGSYEVFLDPPDQLVDRTMVWTTGSAPKQVAFTPDGAELWVTLLAGSGVEVYDPVDGALLAEIDLPEAGSVEVIFDGAGETAWVSQMETATVYEIDVGTRQIRRELDTGGSWTKVMVLDPAEDRLWASNWVSNDVTEFDLTTGEMTRRIPTVTTPRGLATDPAGTRLYVAGYDSGDIAVIDLDTGATQVIEDTGGAVRHLVADPASGLIYASDMARDTILAIDTANDSVSVLATTDRLPNTIDISPDGRILAVSNRGRNNSETYYLPGPQWGSILLLNTATGDILDAIVGGNQPTGLDISADGRLLAYSDFLDNRVTVVALPPTETLLGGGGGRVDSYRSELEK
jgi:DNA-binding beta-propeller fold protein YncE